MKYTSLFIPYSKQRGFTLVELLVVIAIIGLLSTIGVVSLNSARAKARDAKRLSDIRQMISVLEIYYDSFQRYPNSLQTGTKIDGGCLSEGKGIEATPCLARDPADVILVNQIPSAPPGIGVQEYRYFGYVTEAPSSAPAPTKCDGALICASYGIEFTLESTISGIPSGKSCFTLTGILPQTPGSPGCPVPS